MKSRYDNSVLQRLQRVVQPYLRENGLARHELADKMGLDPSYCGKVLNARKPLNTDFILDICRITGTPPGEISEDLADIRILH